MGGPISSVVAELMRFYADAIGRFDTIAGARLHDALAVAAVFQPDIIGTRRLNVAIETASELGRGQTVVDLLGASGRQPNADVALELDAPRFRALIISMIERLDRRLR